MTQAGLFMRPAFHAYQGFWRILDYIYPPTCIGCGKLGSEWCEDCQSSVRRISGDLCEYCGEPVRGVNLCARCKQQLPSFRQMRSYAEFEGVLREGLHSLKYKKNLGLGIHFSILLVQLVKEMSWDPEIVIPVPLSRSRMQERGYNQASLIAYPMALALGVRYSERGLQRVRNTISQVNLSIAERRLNVSGAFQGNRRYVQGRRVLVVDDTATTGATITACADALIAAGARDVFGVTLARAVRQYS